MWTSAKYHLFMANDWKLHPNSFALASDISGGWKTRAWGGAAQKSEILYTLPPQLSGHDPLERESLEA